MNNEFKKISQGEVTRYVLESASGGGTSAGGVASVTMPIGGTRKRGDNLIAQEGDKITVPVTQKPRLGPLRPQTGGGAHRDKKREQKQGTEKHKKRLMPMESPLLDKEDLQAKRKALQDLLMTPGVDKRAVQQRKLELEKEARAKGMVEGYFSDQDVEKKDRQYAGTQAYHAKKAEKEKSSADAKTAFNAKFGGDNPANALSIRKKGVVEAPIEMDPAEPMNPMIHNHQGANPAKLQYRMARAAAQFKELAKRAENGSAIGWESIARQFDELAMNVEQIKHGLDELAAKRKKGGVGSRGIDPNIGEHAGAEYDDPATYNMAQQITAAIEKMTDAKSDINRGDTPGTYQIVVNPSVTDKTRGYGTGQTGPGASVANISAAVGPYMNQFRAKGWIFTQPMQGQFTIGIPKQQAVAELKDTTKSSYKEKATQQVKDLKPHAKSGEYRDIAKNMIARREKGLARVSEDEYMMELAGKLAEKIPTNAPTDVWVKDFQKANPNKYHQFKNKTPAKKAQMAVAASYAAKNPSKKK
jgi:hypothetical protein